jgi:hypothetical protein
MDAKSISRRGFSKLAAAAIGGAMSGLAAAALVAQDKAQPGGDVHVCRGLNACKGHGASGKNECAGQGACATAKSHACKGDNACKGQGGCGANPGENACKGKGECAVPLSEEAWKKARRNFEAAMAKAGKKFGPAPKK